MSDELDHETKEGGRAPRKDAVEEMTAILLRRIRTITAPPGKPQSHLCINELTDEEFIKVWKMHGQRISGNQIADTAIVEWGRCLKYQPKQVAQAFRKLFARMRKHNDVASLELVNIRKQVATEKMRLRNTKQKLEDIKQDIEKTFNPLKEMAVLAVILRDRLLEMRAQEKKQRGLYEWNERFENLAEKTRATIKEVANIAEMQGLYKHTEDPASATIRDLHLHLSQNVVNAPAIKEVGQNFLNILDSLATSEIDTEGRLLPITTEGAIDANEPPIDVTPAESRASADS